MKLIIEVTEDHYKYLKDKMHNRKATISDATILDGTPYEDRPQGEWVYGNLDHSTCSNCNYANHYGNLSFCPNCGADMRGGT